jgi:hypothetical protein
MPLPISFSSYYKIFQRGEGLCHEWEAKFRRSRNKKQTAAIEGAAQGVLDARAAFRGSSLADLYDPLSMPPALVKAHQKLDAAVDAAYRRAQKKKNKVAASVGILKTSVIPAFAGMTTQDLVRGFCTAHPCAIGEKDFVRPTGFQGVFIPVSVY